LKVIIAFLGLPKTKEGETIPRKEMSGKIEATCWTF